MEIPKEEVCPDCGKKFIVSIERLPAKWDDKRETYYCCPYCNKVISDIHLLGNEEVYTQKIEDKLNNN